jgi:hypothetical protein
VELEKDLSVQKQLLDVVIIEKTLGKRIPQPLPNGLENLAQHNLLTYKSHHEPLDGWALKELIGHYVNYRKQTLKDSKKKELFPEAAFQLYAVAAHYPQQLAKQVELQMLQTGVYEVIGSVDTKIRLIITSQVPETPNNTIWQLFSGVAERFQYAQRHHVWRDPNNISSIINQMYQYYQLDGVFMSYTLDDFRRDNKRFVLEQVKQNLELLVKEIPSEDLVKHLSSEARLQGLSPETRLQGLSPETRLQGLSSETRLQGLSPETRLQGLSVEEIEAYLAKVKKKS